MFGKPSLRAFEGKPLKVWHPRRDWNPRLRPERAMTSSQDE
jgi:hypothetical protein